MSAKVDLASLSDEELDAMCAELAASGELDPSEYLSRITGVDADTEIDAAEDLEFGRFMADERWAV